MSGRGRKPGLKPLTSESPEPRVCRDCLGGFMSIRDPQFCPFCGEEGTID